jgi:polysaccharide deacetylase family protein (PEP-CTERM system associated)
MKNALTIDLEDWYHPELVKRHVAANPQPRVVEATLPLLDLLDRHRVRATFFILGDVAQKHPDLVRDIHARGHEIASHGMTHTPLWDLDDEGFGRELSAFRRVITDILGEGVRVAGFRAPTFSMDNGTRYAMRCLLDHGYAYDTSIFPLKNPVYGLSGAPCTVYRPDLNDLRRQDERSGIVEFPMTVFEWGRLRIPMSGGFYLRVTPYAILKRSLRSVNRTRPFVIYFHPWELYSDTPRVRGIGFRDRLITYTGMSGAMRKVERLLEDFEMAPMSDVLESVTGVPHVSSA